MKDSGYREKFGEFVEWFNTEESKASGLLKFPGDMTLRGSQANIGEVVGMEFIQPAAKSRL